MKKDNISITVIMKYSYGLCSYVAFSLRQGSGETLESNTHDVWLWSVLWLLLKKQIEFIECSFILDSDNRAALY